MTRPNQSGEHLLALINDVLDMSKIEAGQATLNQESFDIRQLLKNLEAMLKFKAESKGLVLIMTCDPDVSQWIRADQQKLRQVLINLLGNALKFTHEGDVRLNVTVGTPPEYSPREKSSTSDDVTQWLHFAMKDSGPGIAPDELSRLFDSFCQGEQGKQQGGTGLGMAISKSFVELMGGELQAKSTLGEGSEFYFELPVGVVAKGKTQSGRSPAVIKLEENQPDYRILVVDNNQANQLLMVQLLKGVGLSVRTANNGLEAIECCQEWYPHLIWMDVNMPVMGGYEATLKIKRWSAIQRLSQWSFDPSLTASSSDKITRNSAIDIVETPTSGTPMFPIVIALTANIFESDRQRMSEAGCSDFVCKPLQREIIFQKMAEYLGVRYCYESSSPDGEDLGRSPALDIDQKDISSELDADMLRQMPREWVQQLHNEACLAEEENILNLVSTVAVSNPDISYAITTLINQFDYGKIIRCTEEVLKHE